MENEDTHSQEATLSFKLPRASFEFRQAINAPQYASTLEDIYNICRSKWKYDEYATNEEIDLAQEIASLIADCGVLDMEI